VPRYVEAINLVCNYGIFKCTLSLATPGDLESFMQLSCPSLIVITHIR
jgi:hypothetical protein